MPTLIPRLLAPATVVAAVVLTGCSGGATSDGKERAVIRGKLVKNGNPFVVDESTIPLPKGAKALPPGVSGSSLLEVTFIAVESKTSYTAKTNAQAGTFEVGGDDGKGIPAGRYKVAVTARVGIGPDTPDMFKGQYTPEKTQIVRDVKPGEEIMIDVAKPQG